MSKKKILKKTTTTVEEIIESNEKTQIICILDSSGSMLPVINDAIGGFDSFVNEQKELEGDASLTVALFDSYNSYSLLYDNVNIHDINNDISEYWFPRGLTALYDAIGKTINHVSAAHKKLKKSERPDKVLCVIATDGYENNSKEYTRESIRELIKAKEKDDWQFIYLAADQDAFDAGTSIGVSGGNTLSYTNTGVGNRAMFSAVSTATANYRNLNTNSVEYPTTSQNLMSDITNGSGSITLDSNSGDIKFSSRSNSNENNKVEHTED